MESYVTSCAMMLPIFFKTGVKSQCIQISRGNFAWANLSLLSPFDTVSEARTRQGRGVSRIGYVSDTDTPGIRSGYVSAAYPCIPAYLGWKLTIGNVLVQSIRPSRPNSLPPSHLCPTPVSRPLPVSHAQPPHAVASAGRQSASALAGDQPPPLTTSPVQLAPAAPVPFRHACLEDGRERAPVGRRSRGR